jgi:hypothetical protein
MTLQPPNIADLDWSHDHTAIATEGYRELHRTGKTQLARAGLRVEKDGGGKWRVRFRPDTTSAVAIRDGIAAAREARVVVSISMSDVERQNREREDHRRREWEAGRPAREAERQRQLETVEARRRERVLEVQAMGRDTLERWGEFTERKVKLRELVDAEDLTHFQVVSLLKLVRATGNKAIARRAMAVRGQKSDLVNWDDNIVIQAIEVLTRADSDHATVANKSGWSSSDSSTGHWAAALLKGGDDDRRIAILAGRALVGKYVVQLRAAGIGV